MPKRFAFSAANLWAGSPLALLALLTGLSVAILFIIIGYTVINGIGGIDLAFFTDIPKPLGTGRRRHRPGDPGFAGDGRRRRAYLGATGHPHSHLSGRIWSELLCSAVRFALELLASLPSIVVGVFVWALIVRTLTGFSGWAGAIALAVIMVPIIARSVEEILRLVPDSLREAALALGIPRWRVVLKVVVPTVLPGILTGVVLAIARAAGETAPLLLTSLGNQFFNSGSGAADGCNSASDL